MLALWFIALHMVGDYCLSSDRIATNKLTSHKDRFIHVFLYTLGFAVFFITCKFIFQHTWLWVALGILSIFIPHYLIDSKRWVSGVNWAPKPIMFDQSLHMVHLAIVATIFFQG